GRTQLKPEIQGTRGVTSKRRRSFRGWRRVFIVAMALVAVFILVTARLLVWPAQGTPDRVDAIVMLAGPGDRLAVAMPIARERRAPVLVVSQGWQGYGGPFAPAMPGGKGICLGPQPGNTPGEAEFTGKPAQHYALAP